MEIRVESQELIDEWAFVPGGAIHIEVDDFPPQAVAQTAQHGQKGLGIALGHTHHPMPTEQRCHPAEDVQSLAVFAARRHAHAFAASRPQAAEAGMFGEARLVFKHQDVAGPQMAQFFLTAGETFRPLPSWPAGRRSRGGSSDSPADAASSGLGEPSGALRSVGADEPPKWDRPTPRAAVRVARDSFPDPPTPAVAGAPSVAWGVPGGASRLHRPALGDSSGAPNGSNSC